MAKDADERTLGFAFIEYSTPQVCSKQSLLYLLRCRVYLCLEIEDKLRGLSLTLAE